MFIHNVLCDFRLKVSMLNGTAYAFCVILIEYLHTEMHYVLCVIWVEYFHSEIRWRGAWRIEYRVDFWNWILVWYFVCTFNLIKYRKSCSIHNILPHTQLCSLQILVFFILLSNAFVTISLPSMTTLKDISFQGNGSQSQNNKVPARGDQRQRKAPGRNACV